MRLSLVIAAAENDVIGRDGTLPWHLPDDLKRFKALTIGKPILMGRKTFESIGRPLPSRLNLVLTRQPKLELPGARVVHSLADAIAAAEPAEEVMIIGGEAVFAAAFPHATTIHLTRVHAHIAGGVRFTIPDLSHWRESARTEHPADGEHAYAMTFTTLERLPAGATQ